ncbi:MAG: urocanate hydratase [Deltaproteobacteria bacterium]|nr:urocanate hydratase [Deltaproteobacteria bacterium]
MDDSFRLAVVEGIPEELPSVRDIDPTISHAPARRQVLTPREKRLAVRNALRYLPAAWHETMAPELAKELETEGRIYIRRLRPTYAFHARPIDEYPARSRQAAAIMVMISNNLDSRVAQYPEELITYGGNGAVFQNWAQYRITMRYLSEMSDEQTLVLYSGHPLGVFPSHREAPRLVVTNGMVVPNYSSPDDYERLNALGVTSYGQMTAGSFMYIGPQGIVHGTTITLLNAGRLYLGVEGEEGLSGKVFVSSGLGGMSGAQAKAAVIAGGIGVVAEVNPAAVEKRRAQGWVMEVERDLASLFSRIAAARAAKEAVSIAYEGNIVDLWEYAVEEGIDIELGSDQTSLHNPYGGGYYPVGLSFEEGQEMMVSDPEGFRDRVQESLRRHVLAVNALSLRGMSFWDYGNAFLLEASRAGADVLKEDGGFRYPSYVEDIMGPLCFDYGFGPFRWVCTSGLDEDLAFSDALAGKILAEMAKTAPKEIATQIADNLKWIQEAGRHELVVGSKARILYADEPGRIALALAFNKAIREGEISAPIVLGRDHHDVSGTDSPYRETANIKDGSAFCADMSVQNVIGDAFRGATWVSLHNGGGVGWGEVINGGFGMVLDGSDACDRRIRQMLYWDVNNGLARRAWAGNANARFAVGRALAAEEGLQVTLAEETEEALLDAVFGSGEEEGAGS